MRRHTCSVGPGRCPNLAVRNLGPDEGGPWICSEHLLLAVFRALGMPLDFLMEEHSRILAGKGTARGRAEAFA